jgi:hypothetical protein
MKLALFISMYLVGYLAFATCAAVDPTGAWFDSYFIWQSLFDGSVFAWIVTYNYVPKREKKIVRWPMYLSVILFVWEIVSAVTGININNHIAVFVFYLLVIGVITYLVIRDFRMK